MRKFKGKILRKANTVMVMALAISVTSLMVGATFVFASSTSNFQITINHGTLSVDIVDGSYVTVGSPSVIFSAATFSYSCQTPGVAGTFGTATEQIYVQNPDAADNGWTVSLAGSATTAVWDSAGIDMDFNDPTTGGCTDGADTDTVKGQLTVDPSGGTLAVGNCASCATTNITLGSSSAFNEGTVDSITLLTAAAGSDDIGDWTLRGVSATQTIPAEQPAASDYDIKMVLSVVAS